MAKNFKKDKPQENAMDALLHKHLSSNVEFEIGSRKYIIKKWKNREVLDRLPIVGNLFYVPIMVGAEEDELGEQDIDFGTVVGTLFHRLQEQEVVEFMEDMLSCVYVKGVQEKAVDLDEDFDDMEGVFLALTEVLSTHFFALFSPAFTGMMMMGLKGGQISSRL